MIKPSIVTVIGLVLAGAAFAHSGVMNPVVKARMDTMSAIGAEMKTLGQMAKGVTAFDGEAARASTAAIAKLASAAPALFQAKEDDPKSEAKIEIWNNFADFTEKAKHLETVALELSTDIKAESDLAPAMKSLGEACQACHKPYRE